MPDPHPHRDLRDPAAWRAAQTGQIGALTAAAFALGQLEADLAALPPPARAGATRRLALRETGALLAALGPPIAPDTLWAETPGGEDPARWRLYVHGRRTAV